MFLLNILVLIMAFFAGFTEVHTTPILDAAPISAGENITEISPVEKKTTNIATSYKTSVAYTPVVTSTPANYISVAGKTIAITNSADTKIDAGNGVKHYLSSTYGNKLYYGHNSAAVFGGLKTLRPGDHFTIRENGVTKTYRIRTTATLAYNDVYNRMAALPNASYNGTTYDVVLMTCAGTDLGNGQATHRLLIFAIEA